MRVCQLFDLTMFFLGSMQKIVPSFIVVQGTLNWDGCTQNRALINVLVNHIAYLGSQGVFNGYMLQWLITQLSVNNILDTIVQPAILLSPEIRSSQPRY